MEHYLEVSYKIKRTYHIIQQLHSGYLSQKKNMFTQKSVFTYS